jgi:flagellar biosynthesis protein FliP
MKKNKNQTKLKWYLLLFLAVSLFLIAMATRQVALNLIVIGLAIYIYQYGNPVLFESYEAKRQKKLADSLVVRQAAQEVLESGKLLKKNKGDKKDVRRSHDF